MKISKHRRLSKVMDILDRWGPLDIGELTKRLSALFGVDESDLKRNVLNDLKFLRDEGDLVTFYYNKFGEFLGEEEPDDSFFRLKWQSTDKRNNLISGLAQLKNFGCDLIFRPTNAKSLKIKSASTQHDPANQSVFFEINNELHQLQITAPAMSESDQVYFSLHIGRNSNETKDLKKLLKHDNQAYLLLNDPFLSSIDKQAIAPISIDFLVNRNVRVFIHSMTNKVTMLNLENAELQTIISELTFHKDQTKTRHWTEKKELFKEVEVPTNALPCPLMLKVKEGSGFLIN